MVLIWVIRPGFNQLHNSDQRSLHLHTLALLIAVNVLPPTRASFTSEWISVPSMGHIIVTTPVWDRSVIPLDISTICTGV